jgi:hypothetical protein
MQALEYLRSSIEVLHDVQGYRLPAIYAALECGA